MKEIKQLLKITNSLRKKYGKNFTLDGKLVGDIGEVLAKEKYGLKLYAENEPTHDGEEKATGKKVQIKSSFKNNSYFPHHPIPEYFLSLNILENGELEELFNGPGQYILEHYIIARGLKKQKEYSLAKSVLHKLNKKVPLNEKIREV